ncbi:MAG: hypothetical protein WA130_18245 [Candidatus Methanoperedens sp.]
MKKGTENADKLIVFIYIVYRKSLFKGYSVPNVCMAMIARPFK